MTCVCVCVCVCVCLCVCVISYLGYVCEVWQNFGINSKTTVMDITTGMFVCNLLGGF